MASCCCLSSFADKHQAKEDDEQDEDLSDFEIDEEDTPQQSIIQTKKKSSKKPTSSSVTPSSSTTKKSRRSASVSSHPSDSEDEENTTPDSQSRSKHRETSPTYRRSAGRTEEITHLKSQIRTHKMAKSQEQKRLERENAQMREELEAANAEKARAEAKAKAEARGRKSLQEKYHSTLAKVGGTKAQDNLKNKAMVDQVRRTVKKKLWAFVKFIGNDKQLAQATTLLIDLMKLKDLMHVEGESEAQKEEINEKCAEFRVLYSTDVRQATNDQRSYYQGEAKKIYTDHRKNGGDPISYAEFKEVAFRDVTDNDNNLDPKKVKIFDLYALMLSACSGSSTYGEKQRRTLPVSTAKKEDGRFAVPFSTEAMVLVMFDNCVQKWDNIHQFKEVEKNIAKVPKYSPKKHEETKQWMTKYSDACSGNCPYGGWSKDGIKLFKDLSSEIKDLRETRSELCLEVETAAVQRFHDLYVAERKRKAELMGRTYEEGDDSGDSRASKKSKSKSDDQELAEFDMGF